VPAEVSSFFSRFTMKLVEIVGAGIATAVGGYLVAHLGAYLSSPAPTPAAVEIAPNTSVVTKAPRLQSVPPKPVSAEVAPAPAKGALSAKEVSTPAASPARTTAKVRTEPVHRHTTADANPAEGKLGEAAEEKPREAVEKKPREATEEKPYEAVEKKPHEAIEERPHEAVEKKPHEAIEGKPRDMEAVEAEVRAALAKVDANRPQAPAAEGVLPPTIHPPAIAAPPKPPAAPVAAVAVVPPATAVVPQPAPQAPLAPAPLGTVEIKSQPVAAPVEAVPPSPPQENAQDDAHKDKGLFSTIEKIPDMLRPGAGATTSDPPRPPMPVGQ